MQISTHYFLYAGMLLGCTLGSSYASQATSSPKQAVCETSCHVRKYRERDVVCITKKGSDLAGKYAVVVPPNHDLIEKHRTANNCPAHCIIYSLLLAVEGKRIEECQANLASPKALSALARRDSCQEHAPSDSKEQK